MKIEMNRRQFMIGSGSLVVSVLLPGLSKQAIASSSTMDGSRADLGPDQLSSYISVQEDGRVIGWIGKVDMAQGTEIGWIKIIAEELDVSPDAVSIVQGNTDQTVDQGGASGSTGIWKGGAAFRGAAAEARYTLLNMAAQKLAVKPERLVVNEGIVSVLDDQTKSVTYSQLIGGRQFNVQLEWNKEYGNELAVKGVGKPKSPAQYKIIGKPGVQRRDIVAKVLGRTPNNTVDVKVPGMLHGRVIRPNVAGSAPVSIDKDSVSHIPSVQIVWQKDFIGVVAPREWDAVRAARELKIIWSDVKPPFPDQKNLYDHIRAAKVTKRDEEVKVGDIDLAFSAAANILEAEYEWPFHSHTSMAPACTVADIRDQEAYLWIGGQKPHHCREGIAAMFNLDEHKVVVKSLVGPGSYGRNDSGDVSMDAAVLSKAVGKPVRVQAMRHEATGWDPKSPASVHRARAAIDKTGKVIGWDFSTKGFSRREFFRDEGSPERTLAGQLLGWPLKPVWLLGVPSESYSFEAKRKTSDTIGPLLDRASPLRTSHFRDPGGPQIHFASESFMDELAVATNMDAVEFRLRYLKHPQDLEVVKTVAMKASWIKHIGARKQRRDDVLVGQGIAYAVRGATRVAVVADVEVNVATHRIWVRKVFVAHDCGQVIAPDLIRPVIEAQVVQTISRAVYEEVKFDRNNVTSIDWAGYPIIDIKDVPELIDITLIDHPELPPAGAAEATCRVIPAAIANAIFDATGVRLRQAPLTTQKLKIALGV